MLQPIKTKFRKAHKGRIHGQATSGASLAFGEYGLKAMEPERVTARQIEAARRALTRHMKRAGRVWIRVFPDVPVTKKPLEVRMGSGKGGIELWVTRVKPGGSREPRLPARPPRSRSRRGPAANRTHRVFAAGRGQGDAPPYAKLATVGIG